MTRLGDYIQLIGGGTPNKKNETYWGGSIPWMSVKDLKSDYVSSTVDSITQLGVDNSSTKIIPAGSLIIATRMAVGKVIVTEIETAINQDLKAIRILGDIDKNFLFYVFKSKQSYFEIIATGATVKGIKINAIADLKIPLPPLPQQKKIAAILDAADAYRQKTKALIAKYEELAQSLFLEMFGDPVRNPMGWEKVALKSFGEITTGNTPSRKNEAFYSSRFIEWVKTNNISSSEIYVTKGKEYLSKEGLANGRSVEKGSLLVTCIAGSINSIGRSALTDRKVAFNQQINAIEPNKEVSSLFLYHLFRLSIGYIQDHATFGMKRMLSKGEFQKILMIKPPYNFQNQFAERVQAIESQKAQAQASLAQAEDLFNCLLQKAFKGELT